MKHTRTTAIAALIAGILLALIPNAATASSPSPEDNGHYLIQSNPDATTRATATAERVYRVLVRRTDRARARGVHDLTRLDRLNVTYLPRIETLPPRVRAVIDDVSLRGGRGAKASLDADGLITFYTGAVETGSCLDLNTGAIEPGRCGYLYQPPLRTLFEAYDVLVSTLAWADQNAAVYGAQARDNDLLISVLRRELPSVVSGSWQDADRDGTVDDGLLVLSNDTSCGTIVLPEHDETGRTYSAMVDWGVC